MCSECGCIASAGLASIGRFKLAGLLRVGDVFKLSRLIGETLHPERAHNGGPKPAFES
jgi:hypothetical protein